MKFSWHFSGCCFFFGFVINIDMFMIESSFIILDLCSMTWAKSKYIDIFLGRHPKIKICNFFYYLYSFKEVSQKSFFFFVGKNFVGENFHFWRIILLILGNISFLSRILDLAQNFDFWQKFSIFGKVLIKINYTK